MDDIREAIEKSVPSASDIMKVTEYEVWLGQQPITLRIFDREGDPLRRRYVAEAFHSDLPIADRHNGSPHFNRGHDEDTASAAIASIQWDKLA